jgi:5-methylcytosine-specific restriction endonuclease McrA
MAGRPLNPEYWKWRGAVLIRDGKKCQFPNCRRRSNLQIHHIIPWSRSVALRYAVSNGITLCTRCHHSIKGKEALYVEIFRLMIEKRKKKP